MEPLPRLLAAGDGEDLDSMIVCEREARFGTARGPPGTVGTLGMMTGRGVGMALLLEVDLCSLFEGCAGNGGTLPPPPPLLPPPRSFFILAFRPNDEKNPLEDFPLEEGEATVCVEEDEESEVVVVDTRDVAACGGCCASEGYGSGGGPRGRPMSPLLE